MSPDFCRIFSLSLFKGAHILIILSGHVFCRDADKIKYHFFGDGDYAAVTGWPNMIQTLSHDGWMGIAPSGKRITMRSLDFWREEKGLIRENWVLVDLLDVYQQIGVDVFVRMREFNKVRAGFDPKTGQALT